MHSIDPISELELRQFFEHKLQVTADALRAEGVRFFPLAPENDQQSWYETYRETDEFFTLDDTRAELEQMWAAQPQLLSLIPELVEQSRRWGEKELAEEADVSPFVYAMF